ncbi:50S ribosomal protein L29 [Dissostichus eleginoides]|uniref:50S ribosomal protein L29 n=1 Tax=Dissostichus eleginoides TaxID=100907 RepID=A0AAD9EYB3_DISEL|nr:50S ribosomal protein L29 [Dissostichus eleginoides]
MDPELLINPPESDEDLFNIGYPPSTAQQSDHSQASEWSRLRSAASVSHTSRHFHSSSPNEIPPTPDRSQASSPSPVRANNRGRTGSTNPPTTSSLPHSQPPATHRGALDTPLG